MSSKEVANFFWHGNPLSIYEICCLKSFVKHNWIVNLWSFDKNVNVPDNVNVCDASNFYKIEDIQTFTQQGKQGCIAAFSDAFRYKVLQKYQGWWFDTDCICLKDQSEFFTLTQNKRIVAGYENNRRDINGAILNFVDSDLASLALSMMEKTLIEKNRSISWGEIGPKLITELVKNKNLEDEIFPQNYFYPIHYKNALDIFDETKLLDIINLCKESYTLHLWNEVLKKKKINKNPVPDNNSFMNKLFNN